MATGGGGSKVTTPIGVQGINGGTLLGDNDRLQYLIAIKVGGGCGFKQRAEGFHCGGRQFTGNVLDVFQKPFQIRHASVQFWKEREISLLKGAYEQGAI